MKRFPSQILLLNITKNLKLFDVLPKSLCISKATTGSKNNSTHNIIKAHTILNYIESNELIRGRNNPIRHKPIKFGIGNIK